MRRALAVCGGLTWACGCALVARLGGDYTGADAAAGQADGPQARPDGGLDASGDTGVDGSLDSAHEGSTDTAPTTVYFPLDASANWETLDLTSLNIDPPSGFGSGAFDGRYVYLVPANAGPPALLARYDTSGGFGDAASWASFDLTQVIPTAGGYQGAVFDGRYLYFAPTYLSQPGTVLRYDTTTPFGAAGAWATFDVGAASGGQGFLGAVYDGRFIYLVPYATTPSTPSGRAARYDTQGAFDGGGWTVFDIQQVNPLAAGFAGGVFDGRFVTFVPLAGVGGPYDGLTARFDTRGTFVDAAAWSVFDLATLTPPATGLFGGVFDGQYVYYVPELTGVARHDTTAAFDAGWSVFDVAALNAAVVGFNGGAFDGRYVYLVPRSGPVSRYDTMVSFGTSSAWSFFEPATLDSTASGFSSAAFDGTFVYFVPYPGATVARFRAKSPPGVPSTIGGGSFF